MVNLSPVVLTILDFHSTKKEQNKKQQTFGRGPFREHSSQVCFQIVSLREK